MKSEAISEMILNTLKHEFHEASETRLLDLARQLQEAQLPKTRAGVSPPVSKQKLSKSVLRSLRPAGNASGQVRDRGQFPLAKKSREVSAA
jgi:hypothetical protein